MNFAELVPRLLVGRAVIEGQGVPRDDAVRLAIVPTLVDLPLAQSVVLAFAVGRNAAPEAPVKPKPDLVEVVEVPKLIGEKPDKARQHAADAGFRALVEEKPDAQVGVVIQQEPAPGVLAEVGSDLILTVGTQQRPG